MTTEIPLHTNIITRAQNPIQGKRTQKPGFQFGSCIGCSEACCCWSSGSSGDETVRTCSMGCFFSMITDCWLRLRSIVEAVRTYQTVISKAIANGNQERCRQKTWKMAGAAKLCVSRYLAADASRTAWSTRGEHMQLHILQGLHESESQTRSRPPGGSCEMASTSPTLVRTTWLHVLFANRTQNETLSLETAKSLVWALKSGQELGTSRESSEVHSVRS